MSKYLFFIFITCGLLCHTPVTARCRIHLLAFSDTTCLSVVAADSIAIPDPLNRFYFSVTLKKTAYSYRGTYEVVAKNKTQNATTLITFPQGKRPVRPALRKGDAPLTFIVGFYYLDSRRFYDYFQVTADGNTVRMKYLKAYKLP